MKFVINQIKNFIWYDNFKKSNKKLFTSVYNQKKFKKSEILIEFNGFQTSHVPLSYLSNVLARKYKAECTPEFYLFDSNQKLVYRGRMDESSPGSDQVPTGNDLRMAIDNLQNNKPISEEQFPSMGCNIKWKT